jgi:multidrug transporter EmrE-like cation transporter
MFWLLLLGVTDLASFVMTNAAFKLSAGGHNIAQFLIWQIVGNLCGLLNSISMTLLLRQLPLSVVSALTFGAGFALTQVAASYLVFHEQVSFWQVAGMVLVVVGVLCISFGRPAAA